MADISGVFGLSFAEQIDYLRRKVHLPTDRWDDIQQSAHDRAFVVAGATKADLLADLYASIERHAAGGGLGLEGYRRDFRKIVAAHGWHGWTGEGTAGGEAWRTRVTYMTNVRTSYAAGRYRQLTESGMKYWMWKHSDMAATPRAQHLAWNGLVLPADHPFWKRHFPPQIPPHWGCHCRVAGVDGPEMARALGGDPDKVLPPGWEDVDAEYKSPALVTAGWNFAPGANTTTPLREMIEKKLFNLPAPIGAALWEALAPALAMEQRLAWGHTLDAWLADEFPRGRRFVVGALAPRTLDWLARHGHAVPASAEIAVFDRLVVGAKQRRHDAAGNGLTFEEWRAVPGSINAPGAIYRDRHSGNLIFVAEELGPAKIAVEFAGKKAGEDAANEIVSAFRVDDAAIAGAVKGGKWEVVEVSGKRAGVEPA